MSYSADPALYIYTSLTSGSSHIVTATSRLETILRANRIPFKALDIATDEKARMIWGRRAGKDENGRLRKLPGLVQEGLVLGDLVEIEDWNEYGELKQHVKIVPVEGPGAVKNIVPPMSASPAVKSSVTPSSTISSSKDVQKTPITALNTKENEPPMSAVGGVADAFALTMRQAGQEAAQKAKEAMKTVKAFTGVGTAAKTQEAAKTETPNPSHSSAESSSGPPQIDSINLMQDATSGAWNILLGSISTVVTGGEVVESLQSPTSTAWKIGPNHAITTHRGSQLANVSSECIKQIEAEQAIPEENEP